jgi:pilus assembly protein CpaC
VKNTKIILNLIVSLTILMFSTAAFSQQVSKTITISVGQSETLRFDKRIKGEIRILNPEIADVVNYSSKSLTVVGVSKGVTDIYIPFSKKETVRIRIDVSDVNVGKNIRAINNFLGSAEGIFTRAVGDNIVIDGYAYTMTDYGRVMMALELFKKEKIKNYTKYRPSAVEQINKILQSSGMTSITANLIAGMVFLEGAVGSKNEMEKLKSIIKALHLKVNNLVTIGEGAQIQVKVRFMEISNSDLVNFGMELPSALSISGGMMGTVPIYPSGQQATVEFQAQSPESLLQFKLNMLFKNGHARVLAEPKLVCGSGSKAKLMVGGQIPIVTITANAVDVTYKDFGIMLELEPKANSRGNITLKLKTEVSEVDWSVAIKGYPGFKTRRADTTVTLKNGSTLIISGLYKNNRSKTITKFPLLGHIPIIGELFKSRDYQQNRSSLAIMVTPTIVKAEHLKMKESIQLVESRFLDFTKYLYWDIFYE